MKSTHNQSWPTRHVTFSCERELGRSLWSQQQVLSTVFSPGRGGGILHVTRAGCHICASLWLSHQLNHWQKGRAPSLAALICFPQSIFTLAAFFSPYQSCCTQLQKTSGAGGCLSHSLLRILQQHLTRWVKKKKKENIWFMCFLRADSRQTAFGVALKPSRLPTILLDGQQDPAGIVFKM